MIRPLQTTPHLMLTLSLLEFMKIAQTGRCRCESTLESVSQLEGKGTILSHIQKLVSATIQITFRIRDDYFCTIKKEVPSS